MIETERAHKRKIGRGYDVATTPQEEMAATHVVLTDDEYSKLRQQISMLQKKLDQTTRDHEDTVRAMETRYRNMTDGLEAEKKTLIEQTKALVVRAKAAETEAEKSKDLNTNLLRIARERANAARGLKPKRKRSGYVAIGKIVQGKVPCGTQGSVTQYSDKWTVTLQTPYSITLPYKLVRELIEGDLTGEDGPDLLNQMGILPIKDNDRLWKGNYIMAVLKAKGKEFLDKDSYLFDFGYAANPQTKYWEIRLVTTGPITLPDDLIE